MAMQPTPTTRHRHALRWVLGVALAVVVLAVTATLAVRLFPVPEESTLNPIDSQAAPLGPIGEGASLADYAPGNLSRQAAGPVGDPTRPKDHLEGSRADEIQSVVQSWLDPDQVALKRTTTFGDGSKSIETFHASGGAWEAYSLVRGQLHGAYSSWLDNGVQNQRLEYVGGALHGPCKTWDPAGQLVEEGAYAQGKKRGSWHTWTSEGMPRSAVHYADGELNGICTYWNSDGSIDSERSGEFVDGVKAE